jgi:hypothetical protein
MTAKLGHWRRAAGRVTVMRVSLVLVFSLTWAVERGLADEAVAGQLPSGRAKPWLPEDVAPQCLFLPRTAIPMLAMGARRLDDAPELRDRRLLDLWARPEAADAGVEPLATVPLFRPYFVYDRRTADGTTWHLLGSEYAGMPLGWADGRQLQLLGSRYGYHFNNPKRLPPGVHLYGSRAAAYAAIEAQSRVPPETPLAEVVVAERLEEESWNPLAADAIPPFIELGDDADVAGGQSARLTDTTLTFPFPGENQLVCVGAVAGGPVDRAAIATKKKAAQERAGIAIVFVIDETLSMQKFFGGVADFIDKNLDLGVNAVNVRVAVSWYSDIQKAGDVPHAPQPLQPLNGPGMSQAEVQTAKQRIVAAVRDHRERIIGGDGAQAEELIYPGLIAAIEAAGFEQGENAMVFVIGDAADRSPPADLAALQRRVAELIGQHAVQMAFVQVGDVSQVGDGFTRQARGFRAGLQPDLQPNVIVQEPGGAPLQKRIADLQSQMDRRRTILLGEIAEMETRNCYSQPGPALEKQFAERGIDRLAFDRSHWQFFLPAWGWRYHPLQADATPQLRELVFLAKPESDALIPTLVKSADGLEKAGRIDVDAARKALADVLGRNHTGVAAAIEAAWQGLPEDDRTLGRFLEQGMGLRVRNALLFHRGSVNPAAGPTKQSVQLLRGSRDRIGMARKPGVTWVDAWKVLP